MQALIRDPTDFNRESFKINIQLSSKNTVSSTSLQRENGVLLRAVQHRRAVRWPLEGAQGGAPAAPGHGQGVAIHRNDGDLHGSCLERELEPSTPHL